MTLHPPRDQSLQDPRGDPTPEPPATIPYYGSWGDDVGTIWATAWGASGPVRVSGPMEQLPPILLPDPNMLQIIALQNRVAELQQSRDDTEG